MNSHMYARATGCILGAASCASALWAQGHGMTLDAMAQIVDGVRSGMDSVHVTFSFNALAAPGDNLFARSHMEVCVSRTRMFVNHEYGRFVNLDPTTFHRIASYDGGATVIYEAHRSRASRISRREGELTTKGMGFFDMLMWNPTPNGQAGYADMDLQTVLRSPLARLRPGTEAVNGRVCYVVDEQDAERAGTALTVWIDPGRGWLPVRQQYFNAVNGRLLLEFQVDDAFDAGEGRWFPVAGRKTVPYGDMTWTCVLAVDQAAPNEFAINVNAQDIDRVFDLASDLPPGVLFHDRDNDSSWTIAGADYRRLGESLDLQITNARSVDAGLDARLAGWQQVAASEVVLEGSGRGRGGWAYGIPLSLVTCGAACLWARRRGHPA